MSEDPETARQIAELSLDRRPLLVLDVDEVLIEFVRPFVRFLDTRGVELKLETFRLYGNATDRSTGKPLGDENVDAIWRHSSKPRPNGRRFPKAPPKRWPRWQGEPRS